MFAQCRQQFNNFILILPRCDFNFFLGKYEAFKWYSNIICIFIDTKYTKYFY